MRSRTIILFIILVVYALMLSTVYDPVWVIVLVSAAIAFSSMSTVIAARKLYFLAASSPHSALLAVAVAIVAAHVVGGDIYGWSLVLGVVLIYLAGYAIHRGIDPNVATAVYVSFTASGGVLMAYYALTRYPVGFDLASLIVGDPILATWREATAAGIAAAAIILLILFSYREQISIGLDPESVRLTGINIRFYDWLIFTILGVTVITYIRITGYILQHVLVLLPGSIAISRARGSYEALEIAIVTALSASLLGLHTGILLDLSPPGLTGLYLLLFYLAGLIASRRYKQ